ncbi:MAG: TldD/PmbA family protein, partial [Candidatus Saganbacteria bacterium]|nr:TldD/PmbA family protein [Candidatus Saganbacteria bacterium]
EIDNTIEQAIANSKNTDQDEFNILPSGKSVPEFRQKIFDPTIDKVSTQEKIHFAVEIEKSAYNYDKRIKKTQSISYGDAEYEVEIANSHGLHLKYKGNHCSAAADVIAEANGSAEDGFGFDVNLKWAKLDAQKIGEEAAKNALQNLGAKPIPSQKITLILEPKISVQILGIIAGMVGAEAVQKGKSLFRGKLGQEVCSPLITIEDNGRLKDAIGSAPFDGEGVATQETIVIEKGILKSYLYNTYAAAKDKVKSTGNASRSYASVPAIGPTNIFIKPGEKSRDEIVKSFTKSLLVTRLMGLHTVNPISGDFSVGAVGIFDNQPVRGITIAGNLFNLLKKIEAVGSDLRWFGSIGAPTLLISDISISG